MDPTDPWGMAQRRLYLCTPDRPDLETFVASCIDGGVDVVQLREKHLGDTELVARALRIQRVCADHGVPFVLNDRPDLAASMGADGVHIGQDDLSVHRTRALVGDETMVGLSTHTQAQLEAAVGSAPVDYLSAGPVTATPTKPGRPGTGLGYIRLAVERSPRPVWITGGVTPSTVAAMVDVGARHFVVVRWLTQATDPRNSARSLRQAIDRRIGDATCAGSQPG